MKIYTILITLIFSNITFAQADVQQRLDQLEQTVLDLEIKSLFNKILFSGELTTNFSRENISHHSTTPTKRTNTLISNTFRLNANSNIGKRFKIFTGIESSFFFGESLAESRAPDYSLLTQQDGDHLRVVKAYFDYHIIPKEIVASLGRLPTTDGPPAHFYSLEDRLGTYAMLTYSVPVDGAAISWNISKTLDLSDTLIVRAIWGEGERTNRTDPPLGLPAGQTIAFSGKQAQDDKYKSFMLEYGTKKLDPITSQLNFIAHFVKGSLGRFAARTQRGLAQGDLNVYEIAPTEDEVADFEIFSFHTDMTNLFGTSLDFYLTHKITKQKTSGGFTATVIEDNNTSDGFTATVIEDNNTSDGLNIGDTVTGFPISFLGNTDRITGRSILLGTRYKFTQSLAIGGEYIKTTNGTLPTTSFTQAKTDMYNTIGQSYHAYMAKTFFNKKVITRFGYTNSLSEYELSLQYTESNKRAESVYGLITLKF